MVNINDSKSCGQGSRYLEEHNVMDDMNESKS